MEAVVSLPSLDELRDYVFRILCGHDQLDPTQTPRYEGLVKRRGQPCGLFFQVSGPRMLKNYALWAGDEDRIFYYDSTGVRFLQTRLSEAPDPLRIAA